MCLLVLDHNKNTTLNIILLKVNYYITKIVILSLVKQNKIKICLQCNLIYFIIKIKMLKNLVLNERKKIAETFFNKW